MVEINKDKFIQEILDNTEWLETTEGDTLPCIGIENLGGVLERHGILNASERRTLEDSI
jgi:hypothetical protein